jgi:hypothetical protein
MKAQLELLKSYSLEFQAQLRRINAFVKHPTSIGTSHEGILRRFLQKYIPKRLAVNEGFVVNQQDEPSKQCDIIIWSHLDFAPYFQEGELVIVPDEAVRAVIEVKTVLNKKETKLAFENLHSVRQISNDIYTAIFSFDSLKIRRFLEHIIDSVDLTFADAVNSIYTMKGWCLQRAKYVPHKHGLFMETRPKFLKGYQEPVPLSLILPPTESPIAYGLTHFLAFLFVALDFQVPAIPFPNIPGSKLNGHIFPGHGVKVFSDSFSNQDERNTFLTRKGLDEFLSAVECHMHQIQGGSKNSM